MPIEHCVERRMRTKCSTRLKDEPEGRVDRAVAELAGRQHGVVARWQLVRLGMSATAVKRRLARGSLHQVHRGVYAVGHRVLSQDSRWLMAVLAFGPDTVLSHRSAGQLWRIVPRYAIAPEVARSASVRGKRGIVVHRSTIPMDERTIEDGIPVTTVPRTMLDLSSLLDLRQLERAWNEMEVRGLTDSLSVPDLLARHPGRRGVAKLRVLLDGDESEGITRNEFEEAFVAMLDHHGLPRGRMNADLAVRGRFFEVDCLWSGSGWPWSSTVAGRIGPAGRSRTTGYAIASSSPRVGGRRGSPGISCATNQRRSRRTWGGRSPKPLSALFRRANTHTQLASRCG
jgi:hypothetical protein